MVINTRVRKRNDAEEYIRARHAVVEGNGGCAAELRAHRDRGLLLKALDEARSVDRMCKRLCQSGKFETGQGTCAAICMDQLGVARRDCPHARAVFDKLAEQLTLP